MYFIFNCPNTNRTKHLTIHSTVAFIYNNKTEQLRHAYEYFEQWNAKLYHPLQIWCIYEDFIASHIHKCSSSLNICWSKSFHFAGNLHFVYYNSLQSQPSSLKSDLQQKQSSSEIQIPFTGNKNFPIPSLEDSITKEM